MSLESITITRQFPIVNGFAQLPNNLEADRTAVSLERFLERAGGELKSLSARVGGARLATKHGVQEWIEMPAVQVHMREGAAEAVKDLFDTNRPTDTG